MSKTYPRFLIATALAAAILPAVLSAQSAAPAASSSTSQVTNGIFTGDADYFDDVVRFNQAGNGLFLASLRSSSNLTLGYATRLGSVFLGAFYQGNALSRTGGITTSNPNPDTGYSYGTMTDVSTTELLGSDNSVLGISRTTGTQAIATDSSSNYFDVLVGFGAIGIAANAVQYGSATRTGYGLPSFTFNNAVTWQSLDFAPGLAAGQSDSLTETKNEAGAVTAETSTKYRDGIKGQSYLSPGLRAGTAFAMGDLALRPYLRLELTPYADTADAGVTTYTRAIGSGLASYEGVAEVASYGESSFAFSGDYTGILANAGIDLEAGNLAFGLDYSFYSRIYGGSYADSSGKEKKVSGTGISYTSISYAANATTAGDTSLKTTRGYQTSEIAYAQNSLSPSFTMKGESVEGLSMAFSVAPQVVITSASYKEDGGLSYVDAYSDPGPDPALDVTTTVTKTHDGPRTTAFSVDLSPIVSGAIQYEIVPGSLKFNGGAKLTLARFVGASRVIERPGLDSYASSTSDGTGAVSSRQYSSSLGSARAESDYRLANIQSAKLGVSAGFDWTLRKGVDLDVVMSSTGTTVSAASLSFQIVIRK